LYDKLSLYFKVLVALAQGYCLKYFLGSFLEIRGRRKRINGFLIVITYVILKVALNYIWPVNNESFSTVGKVLLQFALTIILALCFYKRVHRMIAYLAVTFTAVNEATFFLSYVILQIGSSIFELWIWCMENGYISSAETIKLYVQVTELVLLLLFYVMYIVLLYMVLKRISVNFCDKEYRIQRTELYFIITPGIVGLLICVLLRTIMITIENDLPKLLYDKHPILIAIVPAILALSLLSIVYVVKLFQDMIALNRERSNRIILEKQVGSMQKHIVEIERIYSGITHMKHDMKNSLAVIMQLVRKDCEKQSNECIENKELKNYLSELNKSFESLDFRFKTRNTVVDILLNMKYHEAVSSIPDIQIDAEKLLFPDKLNIKSYDIGVIIGNALDNAIEACKKLNAENQKVQTYIRLSSFNKGKMIFIEVENTFNGKLVRKKHSEFPITDKSDKNIHGMGFANMKNTAEKYYGAVDWSVNDNIFTLTVMMKNERRMEHEY